MVVKYLSDDLKTLHTLLFISKFFFKASAPLIYCDPHKWANLTSIKYEKIVALLIASVIHSQRAAAHWSRIQTRSSSTSFASNFLAEYGLLLPPQIKSQLMQDAVQGVPPTTVDYSKYIAKEQRWSRIKYVSFVRLTNASGLKWRYDECSPTEDEWDTHDVTKDGQLINENICFFIFGDEFEKRLNALFFQCSPTSMETLDIKCCNQDMPAATKMSRLRLIRLLLRPSFPQDLTDRIVSFIMTNQAAFPRKKQLQIKFIDDNSIDRLSLDLQPSNSESSLKREKDRNKEKDRIRIYKAIGNPEDMTATLCPGFYDMIENIELDSLHKFTDHDGYRILYGEGPQQANFFKNCDHLRILTISVCDP